MRILYYRALWGMDLPTLEGNLDKIKAGGFDGVEMAVPADLDERKALRGLLDEMGLDLIIQIHTKGVTPEEHIQSFEESYCTAVELEPRLVNAHTGKDYFTVAQNLSIYEHAAALEREYGVPLVHETHRGRATFSIPATAALMEGFPQLHLAADFSHWSCVHESLLQDQDDALEQAIQHTYHIHARVGHPEGPQVSDPRAPEWQGAVNTHLGWWQRIVNYHQGLDSRVLTITPEFGPPDYMPTLPFTHQPVTRLWDINVYMRDLLKERLRV